MEFSNRAAISFVVSHNVTLLPLPIAPFPMLQSRAVAQLSCSVPLSCSAPTYSPMLAMASRQHQQQMLLQQQLLQQHLQQQQAQRQQPQQQQQQQQGLASRPRFGSVGSVGSIMPPPPRIATTIAAAPPTGGSPLEPVPDTGDAYPTVPSNMHRRHHQIAEQLQQPQPQRSHSPGVCDSPQASSARNTLSAGDSSPLTHLPASPAHQLSTAPAPAPPLPTGRGVNSPAPATTSAAAASPVTAMYPVAPTGAVPPAPPPSRECSPPPPPPYHAGMLLPTSPMGASTTRVSSASSLGVCLHCYGKWRDCDGRRAKRHIRPTISSYTSSFSVHRLHPRQSKGKAPALGFGLSFACSL